MSARRWTWVALVAVGMAGCASHHASARAKEELAAGAMVELRGGTLLIGERIGAAYDVVAYEPVDAFLLDATEVTVAAYRRCVDAGACSPAGASVSTAWLDLAGRAEWSAFCNRDRAERAEHPVNCVDWQQARRYCAWAGKRLPTEAEWEWAARNGGAKTAFPWGDAPPPATQPCWSGAGNDAGGFRDGTCPVGSHPADATRAGVKGLAGGVREWTSSTQVVGADSRGRGGVEGRVARGGAWSDRDVAELVATRRRGEAPDLRDARLGFRCASDR